MTDFDAIRSILAVFPPAEGWTCSKIGWRQSIRIEHPEHGMRVCRAADDGIVTVLLTGDHFAAPVLPHRMAQASRAAASSLVH